MKRQGTIKSAMLPYEADVIVTKMTRDDKSMYLGRGEHNDFIAFSSDDPLAPGDMVRVRAEELSGNTFRGSRIG